MSGEPLLTQRSFAGLPIYQPDPTRLPTINALIYGDSGVGKTTLVAGADSVPAMRKVLFVDIEKGDLALRKTTYRPDLIRISKWDELAAIYHALLAGGHDYKTVVVDSLTEVQDLNMKDILITDEAGNGEEDDAPEWKHWNMNQVRVLRLLRNFRDLPINVIFTSLVMETKLNTGAIKYVPDLAKKLSGKVPPIFDNVFYYYMKESPEGEKRYLLTSKTANTVAKNRGSDQLPQVIEVPSSSHPTMLDIYNGIIGGNRD